MRLSTLRDSLNDEGKRTLLPRTKNGHGRNNGEKYPKEELSHFLNRKPRKAVLDTRRLQQR